MQGNKATTRESKILDTRVKKVSRYIAFNPHLVSENFADTTEFRPRVGQDDEYIGSKPTPDGGAWIYQGKVAVVFEAKYQNDRGNAAGDRWHKNHHAIRYLINKDVSYVTFGSGGGSHIGGALEKSLRQAHVECYKEGYNRFIPKGNSYFYSKEVFTVEEIMSIMISVLRDTCRKNEE